MKPYIGITGFMKREEVDEVLKVWPLDFPGRRLMIGVLASQKTLTGQKHKRPNRYPDMAYVDSIFRDSPAALNLIHYNTKDFKALGDQLVRAAWLGGKHVHGLQLNIAWPTPYSLRIYRQAFPGAAVIL